MQLTPVRHEEGEGCRDRKDPVRASDRLLLPLSDAQITPRLAQPPLVGCPEIPCASGCCLDYISLVIMSLITPAAVGPQD